MPTALQTVVCPPAVRLTHRKHAINTSCRWRRTGVVCCAGGDRGGGGGLSKCGHTLHCIHHIDNLVPDHGNGIVGNTTDNAKQSLDRAKQHSMYTAMRRVVSALTATEDRRKSRQRHWWTPGAVLLVLLWSVGIALARPNISFATIPVSSIGLRSAQEVVVSCLT